MRDDGADGAGQADRYGCTTRFQRLATRFLIALLERYGDEAPAVLRAWADEIEGLAGEEGPGRPFAAPPGQGGN